MTIRDIVLPYHTGPEEHSLNSFVFLAPPILNPLASRTQKQREAKKRRNERKKEKKNKLGNVGVWVSRAGWRFRPNSVQFRAAPFLPKFRFFQKCVICLVSAVGVC